MLRPNPGDYNLTYWIAQRFFGVRYVGYVTAYVRSGVSGRTVTTSKAVLGLVLRAAFCYPGPIVRHDKEE